MLAKNSGEDPGWVVGQIKPLLSWFIRALGERLVQLVYELVKARRV